MKKPHYFLLFIFTILIQFYFSIVLDIAERYQQENGSHSPDLSLEMRLFRGDTQENVFRDLVEASKADDYVLHYYRSFDDTMGILNLTQEPIVLDQDQAVSFPIYESEENLKIAFIRKNSDWSYRVQNGTVQLNWEVFEVAGYFSEESPYIDESTNVLFNLRPDHLGVGKYEVHGLETDNHPLVTAPFFRSGEGSQQVESTSKPLFFYLLLNNDLVPMGMTILISCISLTIFFYFVILESQKKRNIHAIYGASPKAYLMKELNQMKVPFILSISAASILYLLFVFINDDFGLDRAQFILIFLSSFLSGGLFIVLYIVVSYLTGIFSKNRGALV